MNDHADHAAFVDRWFARAIEGVSEPDRVRLLELALAALWERAHVTLGEVTLGAVVERVRHHAAERYPFVAQLRVGPRGQSVDSPAGAAATERRAEALRFVLIELLGVLGALTDGIIVPSLQAAIATVPGGAA